ncbi:MAG: Malate dehydrogenase (oxaloacetate-decarboxylating) [Acidimicrobiaceae bacterium]|nr:Malate dehydrogenase (oxaloacetate-decarboxylating) [Acidimicrobiaceae bacterium]
MSSPSASFSVTMRIEMDDPRGVGTITTALGDSGAVVTALDVVEPRHDGLVVDLTCNAVDEPHAEQLRIVVNGVPGARVRAVSDRTLLLHLGGTLSVAPKVPLKTRDDLSMAYTPGVARVSRAIAADPSAARNLTIKRNTVAVVTDGSAVLGLGNIGPYAALPVMEGKALLFKRFADVDAWPVCLDTQDTDEIVRIVECIAPVYGGINLEDIAAPRCFEIERRLRRSLDIPVFHDDQHGTAVVVLAALTNALRVVGKAMPTVRVVVLGVGAAGVAITRLLLAAGIGDVVAVDRQGILTRDMAELDDDRAFVAANTNNECRSGGLTEAVQGADVLIGVSGAGLIDESHLRAMGPDSIVFALANPDPEVDPVIARRHAAVVATGRSDEPNQINNVLVFPGLFRGLLNVGARKITEEMELAAGRALAEVVGKDELSPAYIVPTVFNPAVVKAVSGAVELVASRGA